MLDRKFTFLLSLCIILSGISIAGCGHSGPSSGNTVYVSASGGLRLRSAPSIDASRITTIPDGSAVKVIEEKGELIELSGKTGKWTKVVYNGAEGWVFGGFLIVEIPTADPGNLSRISGGYWAQEPVEPGNMQNWLSVDSNSIQYGYGGMMNPEWYCLVSKVHQESDSVLTIQCDSSRKPEESEVQFATGAIAKESLSIAIKSERVIEIDGVSYHRRDPNSL